MKWIKRLLGLVAIGVLVLTLGGLALSSRFTVTRSAVVAAPAEAAFELLASPKHWRRWTVWNQRDPAMAIDYFGPESGSGAGWSWKSATEGNGRMTLTTVEPGRLVAFDLRFDDFDSTSKGELRLSPEGTGTRITWVMSGDMGANPLMHWFALFADRMMGPDFEAGLSNLKNLLEKR